MKREIRLPDREPIRDWRMVLVVQISTVDFKIKVVGRWLKRHGATPQHPAVVGIGISLDLCSW